VQRFLDDAKERDGPIARDVPWNICVFERDLNTIVA
jgi:hypothetical protein